jgi:8-oxo-dGTP pyrophosphatase MutT (NUDIX family)
MIETDPPPLRDYLTRLREKLARPEAVPLPARGAVKKAAAVMVPLLRRERGLHILYTRRSDRLSSHPGQVAFPGGRFDRRDPHLLAAALRETHEEVGIAPDSIEVLGSFEGRETRATEIFVTPFVGIVHGPVAMRPDPKEVAEIFEVPLAALSDRRYRGEYKWSNNGSTSYHPAILYDGQIIWGLTYYLTLRFLEISGAASTRSTKS